MIYICISACSRPCCTVF